MGRLLRVLLVFLWLVLGLALILAPWLEVWDTNYLLYVYPSLAMFAKNFYLRGAISGLGFLDVMLSLEALRGTGTIASRF